LDNDKDHQVLFAVGPNQPKTIQGGGWSPLEYYKSPFYAMLRAKFWQNDAYADSVHHKHLKF